MKQTLLNDFWGGLAAMLVALPSAIAFGVLVFSAVNPNLAGQGAFVGMMGAAVLGIVAPLIGRTPALISAPCAPAAAILSGVAADLVSNGVPTAQIMAALAATSLLAAFLQMLYGVLKGGQLIKYIPFPVVSGYLSGVSLIIVMGQLPKLLGLPKNVTLIHGLFKPELWQWHGVMVGLITIAVMLLAPKLTQKLPAAIFALLAGILSYFALSTVQPELLSLENNALVIGAMPSGSLFIQMVQERFDFITHLKLADLALVSHSAIALSILLSVDTLKTCVILDTLTKHRHNANRELLGQGFANVCSFISGGMSGAGTVGATVVNVSSGGRTIISGVIEGGLVVLALIALSSLLAWVPIAALAGILLVVAFRIFDWHSFRLLKHKETRFDFIVIATVVIVAESIGLIPAAATGIGLAIFLFIRDQIRITVLRRKSSLQDVSSKTHRDEEEKRLLKQYGHQAGVVDLHGNLFFGTTDHLFTQLETDLNQYRWLLFDMRRVESLDYTAAHLFTLMHDRLKEKGGKILFSSMPSSLLTGHDLQRYMSNVGLFDQETGIRIFETRDEGLEWMENHILKAAGWQQQNDCCSCELKDMELLRELDETTINALHLSVREQSFKANEKIFTVGEQGDELFLIRSGTVCIQLPLIGGKHHHLATFSCGDYFGEMAFLDCQHRSADAVAKTDCQLYILSRKKFDWQVYDNAVLGVKVFARLAKALSYRLRQTDIELCALEER